MATRWASSTSGTIWRDQNPQGTWGYDGQFYYYTALHPLHAVQFMDLPSIRLQRIFFPIVVEIVALAQRPLIPYATLLVNWLAVVGGTLLVALLLKRWGRSPWFALSYALCSGIPVALTFDTAEPLTFALVALGVLFWECRRAAAPGAQAEAGLPTRGRIAGLLAFAAALLTRELAGYFVAGYAAASALPARLARPGAGHSHVRARDSVGAGPCRFARQSQRGPGAAIRAHPVRHLLGTGQSGRSHAAHAGLRRAIHRARVRVRRARPALPGAPVRRLGAHPRLAVAPSALLFALLGNVHLMTFLPRLGYQHQVAVSRYALGLALAAVLWAGSTRPRWLLWLTPLCAFSLLAYLYGLVTQDPAYLW